MGGWEKFSDYSGSYPVKFSFEEDIDELTVNYTFKSMYIKYQFGINVNGSWVYVSPIYGEDDAVIRTNSDTVLLTNIKAGDLITLAGYKQHAGGGEYCGDVTVF